MHIYFEGVGLRPWHIGDAARLAAIADNRDISDNLRDGLPFPYNLQDAINWLNNILPVNYPPRYFAVIVNEEIAGSIGIELKSDIQGIRCNKDLRRDLLRQSCFCRSPLRGRIYP
jgi:hypothetical protein